MALRETSKRWLVWFTIVVAVFAARVGWILYEHARPWTKKQVAEKRTEQDYLTVIPKFSISDFESAQKLVGKPLWVKAGYQAEYFPFPARRQTHASPLKQKFEPMEEIRALKVIERPVSQAGPDKEVLILFQRDSQDFATVVGSFNLKDNEGQMFLDDLFYPKDPHAIYSHWDKATWQKIEAHQLRTQMTYAQVSLSLGIGTLITTEAGGTQLYQFNRKPGGEIGRTRVRFAEGRVTEFQIID